MNWLMHFSRTRTYVFSTQNMTILKLCLLVYLMMKAVDSGNSTDAMKKLYTTLLADYDTRVRPVDEQNATTWLSAYLEPTLVLQLDTELQRLTFSAHFLFYWSDAYLRWSANESAGISHVYLPLTQIWHPVVVLSQAHDGKDNVGKPSDVASISHTGEVSWFTEGVFNMVCEVNIEFYPFDTQMCPVYLYVNEYSREEVLLLPYEDGLRHANLPYNPVWHILDIKNASLYEFETQMIKYTFLFRRRSDFIMYTTIGPLIVLAFLNATAFLVPIETGEKGSIAITLLLSFCVYISSTTTLLPPNSVQNSNLLIFMTILEANSAVTMFYTMVQSYCHVNGTCLSKLFNNRKCCRMSKLDSISPGSDDTPGTVKRDNFVTESQSEVAGSKYRVIDVSMFCLFLFINVVVIGVFVAKIQASFKDGETMN